MSLLDFIEISVGRSIHQLDYDCGLSTEMSWIGLGWYFIRVKTWYQILDDFSPVDENK